jgi:methylated-DNA-[protein]-cysteine S-methyltransferase
VLPGDWCLGIRVSDKGLVSLDYLKGSQRVPPHAPLARDVARQLEAYFADPARGFDVPLDLHGTAFQQRVWAAMRTIAPGHTASYGDLARRLNSAPRAVGQACRRNPLPVIVPCHRVVARQGLGGYSGEVAGDNLRIKQALLSHEGVVHA